MAKNNLDGQIMGRKGQETRQRLMDVTMQLLGTTPLRDLRVNEVAKGAGISSTTFYLYFENVEAVVLALAYRVADLATGVIDFLNAEWSPDTLDQDIRRFVRAYFDFWDNHRPVLRVRNLAAEEGDWGFLDARMKTSVPLHQGLAEKVDRAKAAGKVSARQHSLTLATIVLASMERNAAGYRSFPPKYGITRERLIDASVVMIKSIVLGEDGRAD